MKKFLTVVMCLTMALAMMTVTSFAADVVVGAAAKTAAPGEVVDFPIYVLDGGAGLATGMTQLTIQVPEVLSYEIVYGTITSADTVVVEDQIIVYNDTGLTYTTETPAMTLRVTAPAEAGDYTIAFVEDNFIIDTDYNDMEATFNDIVLTVEAAATEGDPVMTVVPAEEGTSLMVLEPVGTPVEMGVVYQGEGEYKGVAFKSLAPAGVKAAVKVIGLEGTFAPYANY